MSDNPFGNDPNPYTTPQQPGPMGTAKPLGPPPKNYLVESIVLLVCCGGIFAIPAIVYAAQVDGKHKSGDIQGAIQASKNAKMWCIIALCIGVVCTGLVFVMQIFAIMAQQANM